jgi:hypothetical protein
MSALLVSKTDFRKVSQSLSLLPTLQTFFNPSDQAVFPELLVPYESFFKASTYRTLSSCPAAGWVVSREF